MTSYTFSRLGTHGALGNQLWEIAGTYGISQGDCIFPTWDFFPYFSVPAEYFMPNAGDYGFIDLYPDYLQDISHWSVYSKLIKRWFSPSDMANEWILNRYEEDLSKYTAVHVRRANNLALPDHHPVPSLDYFEAALDTIGYDHPLMIFSDDLPWCRQQSIFKDALFAEGNPPDTDIWQLTGANPLSLPSVAYDLLTMAKCKRHVISNSTFSWWSAYLANSEKVVYPAKWFGPALAHINTDLMFTGLPWIKGD